MTTLLQKAGILRVNKGTIYRDKKSGTHLDNPLQKSVAQRRVCPQRLLRSQLANLSGLRLVGEAAAGSHHLPVVVVVVVAGIPPSRRCCCRRRRRAEGGQVEWRQGSKNARGLEDSPQYSHGPYCGGPGTWPGRLYFLPGLVFLDDIAIFSIRGGRYACQL